MRRRVVPATTDPGREGPGSTGHVDLPRAARWHAPAVLAELAAAAGVWLTDEGRASGGEVGACYVSWPDGHWSVLTCVPAEHRAQAYSGGELAGIASAAGVPAPRYELVAQLSDFVAIVQELLPGAVPTTVTPRTVESMVELTGRLRGRLADRAELPAASLYLRTDGPGFCLHGPMAGYDRRTARLLAMIEEAGAQLPERLAGDDLVHFDFHPDNILVDGTGAVTGVVDWDGAARAHGALDLMTLRFDLARRAPELGDRVAALLRDSTPPEVWLGSWAHMSLRLVDWAIREQTADEVSAWVRVATEVRAENDSVPLSLG
jgi:aminoglycoside phosphotransferase (APT) family kinase protein